MTDGGALPAWFSRSVATLREQGWLAATVSVGQAFGGDLEAVTLHTGLLAARHVLGADLVVVAQGPGNLGTGTRWGFSGVAAGEAVNAAAVLGGRPVASLRVSGADPRGRHAASRTTASPPTGGWRWPRPTSWCPTSTGHVADGLAAQVQQEALPLGAPQGRHRLVPVGVRRPARGAARVPGAACRRWAAAWTTTPRRSSPPPPRAATRAFCSLPPRAEVGASRLDSLAGAPSLGATEPRPGADGPRGSSGRRRGRRRRSASRPA